MEEENEPKMCPFFEKRIHLYVMAMEGILFQTVKSTPTMWYHKQYYCVSLAWL